MEVKGGREVRLRFEAETFSQTAGSKLKRRRSDQTPHRRGRPEQDGRLTELINVFCADCRDNGTTRATALCCSVPSTRCVMRDQLSRLWTEWKVSWVKCSKGGWGQH